MSIAVGSLLAVPLTKAGLYSETSASEADFMYTAWPLTHR